MFPEKVTGWGFSGGRSFWLCAPEHARLMAATWGQIEKLAKNLDIIIKKKKKQPKNQNKQERREHSKTLFGFSYLANICDASQSLLPWDDLPVQTTSSRRDHAKSVQSLRLLLSFCNNAQDRENSLHSSCVRAFCRSMQIVLRAFKLTV